MDDLGGKPTISETPISPHPPGYQPPAPSIAGSGSGSVKDLSGKERRATREFQNVGDYIDNCFLL